MLCGYCDEAISANADVVSYYGSDIHARHADDLYVCDSCEEYVDDTGQADHPSRSRPNLCDSCQECYVITCDCCNDSFDVSVWSWRNGEGGYCESCTVEIRENEDEDEDENEDGFDDHAKRLNYAMKGKGVHFGVELETHVENRRKAFGVIRDVLSPVKIVTDGSLDHAHGLEIIAQPYDWAGLVQYWAPFWEKLGELDMYRNENKAGLHVSVHFDHIGALARAKAMLFLSEPDIRAYFISVFGRDSCYYAAAPEKDKLGAITKQSNDGDYAWMRIRNRDKRVEFRMFASPLSAHDFWLRLEFVRALVGFVAIAQTGIQELTLTGFKAYVERTHKGSVLATFNKI